MGKSLRKIGSADDGALMQGFATREIKTVSGITDLSDYLAFRVSSKTDFTVGTSNETATLYPGSITVCVEMDKADFKTPVIVELM